MLRTLVIRDFVIVDAIELDLSAGFTVFTGETGAGKSILIDALTLALGGRGDASVVREGAARADIAAEFAGEFDTALLQWLEEHEFRSDDGLLLLRRVIDNSGRSKAFINGITATITQLREVGEMLVDIHGQHAHQSLMKADAQRALLDAHAGLQEEAKAVAAAYKTWRALARQREEFERDARNVLLERERLEWQVSELEKLAVRTGEWADISNEHSRLSHAASLIEGAQQALEVLSESESSPILSQLTSISLKLGKLADIDDKLRPAIDALEPARIQLQEAVYALNDYLGRIELDPERLRTVESRLEAIHSASRKFHVAPDDLPAEFQTLSERLAQLADASDLDALRAQEEKLAQAYQSLAQKQRSPCHPLSLPRCRTCPCPADGLTLHSMRPSLPHMAWSRWSFWLPVIPARHRGRWPRSPLAANWRASRSPFR